MFAKVFKSNRSLKPFLQFQAYFNHHFYLSDKVEDVHVWIGKYQDYKTIRIVLVNNLALLLKEHAVPKSEFAERFHSFYSYDHNNTVYHQSESEIRQIRNSLLDVSMDIVQVKLELNTLEKLNFLSLFLKRREYNKYKVKLLQLEVQANIYTMRLSYFVDI